MSKGRMVVRSLLPFLVGLPLLLALESLVPSQSYWGKVFLGVGVNVVLAVSLNVVNGFTGQFSIGHAGFMAVGAYTAAKITVSLRHMQISGLAVGVSDQVIFAGALAAGMVTAAVAGLVVGLPSLRLRGDYLAIVTLGFGEIIRVIIENTPFLGRATGIPDVPYRSSLVWAGLAALATISMARRLAGSTDGRALLAIREDEVAAEAMGVDTVGYKVRAFVIAAAFAGLAGGLQVHDVQLATPRMFTFVRSFEAVTMVVLGGMGSVTGSILAAVVLSPEWLRMLLGGFDVPDQYRMVVFSLLLIGLMLTRPSGIFGTREIWDLWPRLLGRRPEASGAAPPAPGRPP